jgi:hypothetical protein
MRGIDYRIPEAWKRFPDSGKRCVYWGKIEKIWNFFLKIISLGVISCGESIARILEKMLSWFRKIRVCIEAKIKHVLISLNQDQGSIFKLRECAQLISRIKLPHEDDFEAGNPKFFDFRFNTKHKFPWIRKAFSSFGNARNRFPA